MNLLKDGERLDDLQYNGLMIIQNPEWYCFTSDAVALANFVGGAKDKNVVELCSGSSVISVLLDAKQNPSHIVCVELQECMCDMARRSVELNKQQDKIEIICADAKDAPSLIGYEGFDIVVANPPYGKINSGETQKRVEIALSRHEIALSLESLIITAFKLLKTKGVFYMVHRFDRLAEIFTVMRNNRIEPKEMRLLYGKNDQPNAVLIKGIKQGSVGLKLLK